MRSNSGQTRVRQTVSARHSGYSISVSPQPTAFIEMKCISNCSATRYSVALVRVVLFQLFVRLDYSRSYSCQCAPVLEEVMALPSTRYELDRQLPNYRRAHSILALWLLQNRYLRPSDFNPSTCVDQSRRKLA